MNALSLSARITLLVGVTVVVIVGAAAFAMDNMVDAEMVRRMDDGLTAQARALESIINIDPGTAHARETPRTRSPLLASKSSTFWAVRCTDGRITTSQPPPPAYPHQWEARAGAQPTFADVMTGHERLRAVWLRFRPGDNAGTGANVACRVLFMRPRTTVDDILSTIDDILLSIPVLAMLVVILLSSLLVRRGLRPLTQLGEAMRGIGPRAPGQRLHARGPHELEPLVARFNEVLTRMDEGVARERQFTGALAHETRTHLAELRSLVDVEQRYPSGRARDDLLDEIGSIVAELHGTVSSLLLLTRLEAGIEGMHVSNVRLGEVVERQLASVQPTLRHRRLRVERAPNEQDATLEADRALLDIVIGNLINNAAAYAPVGSSITINVEPHVLIIENDAPDVDASEVACFGQRFWSKHHGIDGHAGLGLALAGAAASAMQLRLRFSLENPQRLRATLSWPAAPSPVQADAETLSDPRP